MRRIFNFPDERSKRPDGGVLTASLSMVLLVSWTQFPDGASCCTSALRASFAKSNGELDHHDHAFFPKVMMVFFSGPET
jgi:hypothetical protein